jgi:hypothetical protein
MSKKLIPYTTVEEPAPVTVLIPFTKPTEKLQFVIDCLRIQQIQPTLERVGPGNEYLELLRRRWAEGETFYLVEQDVAVWLGAIEQLDMCDHDWCTLPTMCHGRMITTTFGCVKFSRRLIAKNPGFWDDIEAPWYHLDASFADKMGWPWIRPHAHWPAGSHLNEVQWNDSISTRFTLERKMVWQAHEEGQTVARFEYHTPEDKRRFGRRRRGSHVGAAQVQES